MLCALICIYKWRDLQFNFDSERQISEQLSHGSLNLLSEFLQEICWEVIAEEIFLASATNKPTHYLLDHGEYNDDSMLVKEMEKCIMVGRK